MSNVVIGSVPWEKLIEQAAEPAPVRPPGSFTSAEWIERTGKGRDAALRMLTRLVDAGAVRPIEARVIRQGQNRRAIYYVPCAPRNSR